MPVGAGAFQPDFRGSVLSGFVNLIVQCDPAMGPWSDPEIVAMSPVGKVVSGFMAGLGSAELSTVSAPTFFDVRSYPD